MKSLLITVILLLALLFLVKIANAETITIKTTYTLRSKHAKEPAPKVAARILPTPTIKSTKAQRRVQISLPIGDVQQKVYDATVKEFGAEHWEAMKFIINHESGFSPCKINGGAIDCNYNGDRACGLGQSLPCQKMGCSSLEDVDCQIKWLVGYIKNRYQTPVQAMAWWQEHSWY